MLREGKLGAAALVGASILGVVPVVQSFYFLVIHVVDMPHNRTLFIAIMVAVWLVPLCLFVVAKRSLPNPTAADFAFFALICVLFANLLLVSEGASVRDYGQLAVFVVGPYVAARLLPAGSTRPFLFCLLACCISIMAYAFAFLMIVIGVGEDLFRPMILGINHGLHLVGLALLIIVAYASVRVADTSGFGQRMFFGLAGVLAFSLLLLLSSRGMASIAFMVAALAAVAAMPGRVAVVRGVFLVGLVISATTIFSSNDASQQFAASAVPGGDAFSAAIAFTGEPGSGTEAFTGEPGSGTECNTFINSNNSTSIRLALYSRAVDLFMANPLLGVGLRNYDRHFCAETFPHSTLLQVASELGILGLTTAIAVVAIVFIGLMRHAWAVRHRGGGEAFSLAVLLVGVLAVDQIYGELLLMAPTAVVLGASVAWIAQLPIKTHTDRLPDPHESSA